MKKKSIYIIVILSILFLLTGCSKQEKSSNTIVRSEDGKFEIAIPNTVEFLVNSAEEFYTIDLYSKKDEMFLYSTSINKNREIELQDIVKSDKENIIKEKYNSHEISEVNKIEIKDYNAYEYNFKYTDSEYGKDFYSKVVWIEGKEDIHILNFHVINDNIDKYDSIFNDIINSFNEI